MPTTDEPRDTALRRLKMRSMRRGIKEMDLILSRYADLRLADLDAETLQLYDALLSENDQDLYVWVSGQADPPAPLASVIADIRNTAVAGPIK